MSNVLEQFLEKLDYSMFFVTTAVGDERSGCLVGFVTQCSIHPTRFLVCISDKNRTFDLAKRASAIGLHLVPRDAADLIELFGGETGDLVDKFTRTPWSPGPHGVPLLDGCPSRLACEVVDRVPVGDHLALLVQPVQDEAGTGSGAGAGPEPVFTMAMARQLAIEPGHPA